MRRWLGPLLALGVGLSAAGGLLWTAEQRIRAEEAEAIARVSDPACIQYGVRDVSSSRGRGWRHGVTPPQRSPSARRVVVVGDSVTYGLGVDSGETWPRQLEAWLRVQLGRPALELFNFGTNAYDARQIACLVTTQLEAWQPDLVIWGAYKNDGAPTHILHSVALASPIFTAPRVPDELRLLPRPLSDLAIRHSAAWRRLQGARTARRLSEEGAASALGEPELLPRAMAELHDWSQATGIPVLALALPPHVLVDGEGCREPAGAGWTCELMAESHAALVEALADSGLPSADLLPALLAGEARGFALASNPLDGDHPNPAGHMALARAALPVVQAQLGLPVVSPEDLGPGFHEPRRPPKRGSGPRPGP